MKNCSIIYLQLYVCVAVALCCFFRSFCATGKAPSPSDYISYARATLVQNASLPIKQALFPSNEFKKILLGLIHAETKRICLAIYMLTEHEIAKALADAHKRGVQVEIIADHGCAFTGWSKIKYLVNQGVTVYVWPPSKVADKAIMHNKFILFWSSLDGKALLWSGSYNFTWSASFKNRENVLVLEDAAIFQCYTDQFESLKNQAELLDKLAYGKLKRSPQQQMDTCCTYDAFCAA